MPAGMPRMMLVPVPCREMALPTDSIAGQSTDGERDGPVVLACHSVPPVSSAIAAGAHRAGIDAADDACHPHATAQTEWSTPHHESSMLVRMR